MIKEEYRQLVTSLVARGKAEQVAHAIGGKGDQLLWQAHVAPILSDRYDLRRAKKVANVPYIKLSIDDRVE